MDPAELREAGAPCDALGQDEEMESTEEGGGSRGSGTASDVRSCEEATA
jgi:hypothetical protein